MEKYVQPTGVGTFLWWMVASARNLHPELQAWWEDTNKLSACQQEKYKSMKHARILPLSLADAAWKSARRYYPSRGSARPTTSFWEGTSLQVILHREIHQFPQLGFIRLWIIHTWVLTGRPFLPGCFQDLSAWSFFAQMLLVVQPWLIGIRCHFDDCFPSFPSSWVTSIG